ncbi:MAG: hypothetical protein AVDCRST_MAG88-3430 [uncultured Thermomicrobiales bacterium]|uniref:Response regulatory domain-containing protein n=1 Tax=uncultured Thermomicrobiales bacterium TaxID=1645740 RepID=A0A6J4VMR9_9BACT|nr:MAG: hypothetical protein AVDCRST_MAG88-3430 [uncultured Thermomicrobiales bacterium]
MSTEPEGEHGATRIVAVVRDLFFAARIGATLRPLGYRVDVVHTAPALRAATREEAPALVIVDLAHKAIDPPGLIAALKGEPATGALPVLAFGSHLDHAARDAAKAAGADRVVANSKLTEDLPALVERYARVG